MPARSPTPSPQRPRTPPAPPARRAFKVVLIGGHAVGKSSLRSRWLTSNFSPAYRATIGADFVTRTVARPDPPPRTRRAKGGTVSVAVWDTAGQERFRSLGRAFYRGADALILAYDVSSPESLRATEEWYRDFCAAVGEKEATNVLLAAVGCKSDLLAPGEENAAWAEAQRWFARLGPKRSTAEDDDEAAPLDEDELATQRPLSEAPSQAPSSSTARPMSSLTQTTEQPSQQEQQRPGPSVLQVPEDAVADSRSSSGRRSASSTSTATALPTDFPSPTKKPSINSSPVLRTPRTRENSLNPSLASAASQSSSNSQGGARGLSSSRSLRSINLIHVDHSPSSSPPRVRSASAASRSSHARTPSGSTRAASRLSWADGAPSTPPRGSSSGLNVGRSLRGRFDSSVSIASTSGGASMYHTPRGSALFDSEGSGAEEEEEAWAPKSAVSEAEEEEEGAKTPTRKPANGAQQQEQHVDVEALQEGLQKANQKADALNDDVPMPSTEQEEEDLLALDSDDDYRRHAPGLPHVPSGEPIPFPVSPAAPLSGGTLGRSRSRGSKRNSTAGAKGGRPNSWLWQRDEGQKTPSRSRTASTQREADPFSNANENNAIDGDTSATTRRAATPNGGGVEAKNRQTLYEAPPHSMGSTLRPPRANGTPNRDTLYTVAPSASEGDSTVHAGGSSLNRPESPLTDADFDAAASDDEEPWAPSHAERFSVHLTSAKLGRGVEDVFDELIRRAAERWEVEEWHERRAEKNLQGRSNAAAREGGRNWWGGARSVQVALTEEEREREQVRRGIRIAAGKEPRGYWKSCCGS